MAVNVKTVVVKRMRMKNLFTYFEEEENENVRDNAYCDLLLLRYKLVIYINPLKSLSIFFSLIFFH